MNILVRISCYIFTFFLFTGVYAEASTGKQFFAGVMAPLYLKDNDLPRFEILLKEAKEIGVEAVSVDVWWGVVFKDRSEPDWSYYEKIFSLIVEQDLKLVPILATHKCGGGPGDDCSIPLPNWLYTDVAQEAGYSREEMMYKSETGSLQDDAIPPWLTENIDSPVFQEIERFYTGFKDNFAEHAARGDFVEINISTGPTGELRYPSYNHSDGWQFPNAGFFQASSQPALASFAKWSEKKYADQDLMRKSWGICADDNAIDSNILLGLEQHYESFTPWYQNRSNFLNSTYGKDFVSWYVESLHSHGQRLLVLADSVFDDVYADIAIGIKIPGVHWQLQCTETYRAAELSAGLIKNNYDFNSEGQSRANDHGYVHLLKMLSETKASIQQHHSKRDIILHFTALEMDNDPGCNMRSPVHGTSRAESLVYWISDAAEKWNITLRGENALPWVGKSDDPWSEDRNWQLIAGAVENGSYSGFTYLRLWDEDAWSFDKDGYADLIRKFKK